MVVGNLANSPIGIWEMESNFKNGKELHWNKQSLLLAHSSSCRRSAPTFCRKLNQDLRPWLPISSDLDAFLFGAGLFHIFLGFFLLLILLVVFQFELPCHALHKHLLACYLIDGQETFPINWLLVICSDTQLLLILQSWHRCTSSTNKSASMRFPCGCKTAVVLQATHQM